jgi:predicted enzyme related to lactoylglutathione lyase
MMERTMITKGASMPRLKPTTTHRGVWLGFVAVTMACATGKVATAPDGQAQASATQVGRFVWHDLVTGDVDTCRKFYGALLGWDFKETTREGRPYFIARSGGDVVGGMIQFKSAGSRPAAWLSYLSVPDLEGAVAQVTSAGGKVLLEPRPVGAYGRVAVVTDPQGAPLGLAGLTQAPPGADPAEPIVNQFFWMEYLAEDGPAALQFYKVLGGYESTMTSTANGIEYQVLKKERPRAGLLQIPTQATMVRPNWLPYVRVADPAALAARVEALGGRVLIAPRAQIRNGTLAVVADPTGGVIALQKWPL